MELTSSYPATLRAVSSHATGRYNQLEDYRYEPISTLFYKLIGPASNWVYHERFLCSHFSICSVADVPVSQPSRVRWPYTHDRSCCYT